MSTTPNYGWPLLATNQASPEVTHNDAITDIDLAFGGLFTKAMSDADYTLDVSAVPSEASYLTYNFTGTLTADRNIIVPTNKKLYSVWNNTTTPHNLTVKTSGGSGVAVPFSASAAYVLLYCDGTNVVSIGTQSGGGSGALADDSDVNIPFPQNGQALIYVVSGLAFNDSVTDLSTPTAWTNSGCTVSAAQEISAGVTSILATPGSNYAYIDAISFAGKTISFGVYLPSSGLCNFFFGCSGSGSGVGLRLDSRADPSGFFSASSFTSGTAGGGPNSAVPSGIWHNIVIVVASGGTTATWYVDNVAMQTNVAISLNGNYLGLNGDAGSAGGYFSTITVSTGASWQNAYDNQLGMYTVSGLPVGAEGQIAYATNGLKVGELTGSGTGVPVYYSNGNWRVYSTDQVVSS